MQKIGIIGQGFVGSAVREGMKNHYEILAFDKDPSKFSNVESIYHIVEGSELTFLCVPTPMRKNGACDLTIVRSALTEINDVAKALEAKDYIVIIKSTVPPGTTWHLNIEFPNLDIVFNPEFLTEANAVEDYKNQNRIIIGGERPGTTTVKRLFAKAFPKVPIIKTSSHKCRSAQRRPTWASRTKPSSARARASSSICSVALAMRSLARSIWAIWAWPR